MTDFAEAARRYRADKDRIDAEEEERQKSEYSQTKERLRQAQEEANERVRREREDFNRKYSYRAFNFGGFDFGGFESGFVGSGSAKPSNDAIQRIFRKLAAKWHPDRGGSEEAMKALNEFYEELKKL